ncbi:hypothetical protein ACFL1M_00505, partial [Patescibacteria group bacterium]
TFFSIKYICKDLIIGLNMGEGGGDRPFWLDPNTPRKEKKSAFPRYVDIQSKKSGKSFTKEGLVEAGKKTGIITDKKK